MSCVEKKFELQTRKWKWEEYRDNVLVVELWLHRVADDASCTSRTSTSRK
jgi:hypothetical protein